MNTRSQSTSICICRNVHTVIWPTNQYIYTYVDSVCMLLHTAATAANKHGTYVYVCTSFMIDASSCMHK